MDEAALFKFGKWVDYASPTAGVKNFPWKGHGLGHVTFFKILNPFSISEMDEAVLFKFGKWIDYSKSPRGKKIPPKRVVGHWSLFKF